MNKSHLAYCLCSFLHEVRHQDGQEYPGKTLYDLVLCIQFHLEKQGVFWKLVDDADFVHVKFCLDNLIKARESACISGTGSVSAISDDQEELMWSKRILGESNPDKLRLTVLYLIGLNCALRGSDKHHRLRCPPFDSQLQVSILPDGSGKVLVYKEGRKTKTNQGGILGRKYQQKVVKMYQCANLQCCPVRLFEKYVSLLPKDGKSTALYKYSMLPSCRSPGQWYYDKPLGVNALKTVVKDLAKTAGLEGKFSNHSLRAIAATRMFEHGVDEQLIKSITGHKSDAVHLYKRESDDLLQDASRKIASVGSNVSFDIDMVKKSDDEVIKYKTAPRQNRAHRCRDETKCGPLCTFLKQLDKKTEEKKVKKMKLSLKYRKK